ncbi:hypothetical protein PAPHI01_2348 [Pancytospora philotis]|nr:hypothetical protein PAPHI01_2348 [Pancytospora philotis]
MREFVKLLAFAVAFVGARISTADIISLMGRHYGKDDYVDPEGPLNILRGHPHVNNGMIAKQRRFAVPMRLGYSYAGDAQAGDFRLTRNADDDEVRWLPNGSEAMVYLSEHYEILKAMFTTGYNTAAVDKGPQAPFWNLRRSGRKNCMVLFAALLVLGGGGDIRLKADPDDYTDDGRRRVSLVVYDAGSSSHTCVLDLEFADSATMEVVEFFARYGGVKARQVAGYGLHYTDSPSFLIQAYVYEFAEDCEFVEGIFKAARKIVAMLPAGDPGIEQGPQFFLTGGADGRTYNTVNTYLSGYEAVSSVERIAYSAQRVFDYWHRLRFVKYSGGDDSRYIATALLKLCYCLCADQSADRCDVSALCDSENALPCAYGKFLRRAFSASYGRDIANYFVEKAWKVAAERYEKFLAVARAAASASATITECCGDDISAGLATDPKNFLVVLAWVLGEPEEELRSLQRLLYDALGAAGSARHCQEISDRMGRLLNQFSEATVRACYSVCTAAGGARYGSLGLSFCSVADDVAREYVVKLAFKPQSVGLVYVSQKTTLDDARDYDYASALRRLDKSLRFDLPTFVWEEPVAGNSSLCSLIREAVERCLDSAAHRARVDGRIEAMYAAEDPLACHVAMSHWMAQQPMRFPGDAVRAGEQLLIVLEDLLALCNGSGDSAGHALTADSPLVIVLDNILGHAALYDDALREFYSDILLSYASNCAELFPSVCLPADRYPRGVQEWNECERDCFLSCLWAYGVPERLLHYAERHARGRIRAAGDTQGVWDSDVCAAVGRCFRLRYENGVWSPSSDAPDLRHYTRSVEDLLKDAIRAVGSAQGLWRSDLCAAAAGCLKLKYESSGWGLSGDTPDISYYRCSICALLGAAADPAEYCAVLRSICRRWGDTLNVFKVYVLLQTAFLKLPKPRPISPALVEAVFSPAPTAEEVKSLLRVFAVFALKNCDYFGVCRVFNRYRALLDP